MNSKNSKTSEPHTFRLDLTDKPNLKDLKKNMVLANLSIYYEYLLHLEKASSQNTTTNLKFLLQLGMILLIYLMVIIQFLTFRIILNLSSKNRKDWLKIRQFKFTPIIYLKVKTVYKLELLIPETMKLLGKGKKYVDNDKDGKNVPKLESVEVFLVHCNLV